MPLEQTARLDALQNPFDNPLPEAVQSEQEALSVLLSHPHAMAEVADRLQPEHFHRHCHQVLFGVCLELFNQGESLTPGTVTQTISAKGQDTIEAVGGLSYVTDLAFSATLPDALGWHVEKIRDAYQRRSSIVALMDAATLAYDLSNDGYQNALQDAINSAQDTYDLEPETDTQTDWAGATAETLDYLEAPEKFQGLSTGFAGLDAILGGLRGGSQIILAARPGVGKSALAARIALNVARQTGDPVVFFSLEMKRNDVLRRLITAEARQPIGRWVPESQMPQAVARIAEAQERLYQVPLKVFELQSATLQAIQAKVMQHRNKHGGRLALIVVDYLQLMDASELPGQSKP
jgi:replicative DNA helicase